jgi:pyruvate,water dikinase
LLAQPDDIYFLVDREVASALRGQLARQEISEIVERRRREYEWSSRLQVPKVQEGVARVIDAPAVAATGGEHTGIPVSPGVVEGRACVVLDPNDAVLQPGDILVAPVTDVAWTPLFLRAAGLVVEVGGPLSHGSIVAREYGIPAVTAVAGATRDIRTGDIIRIDGSRGTVAVLTRT